MEVFLWFVPWEESITFIAVISVVAILYINGCAECHPPFRQKLYFWVGLVSLYIVSQTQFEYYSEHEFFMHRLQHVVLHHFAPFFIALSRPGAILFAGMPLEGKRWIRTILQSRLAQQLLAIVCQPVIAVILFDGLIFFWLLPSIHFIAMIDWRLYRVMNWSAIITGLMFWSLVLPPSPQKSAYRSAGCRIAMMLAVIPPQIVVGALIFFAPQELYPIYTLCGRAFTHLDPLTDQQIGGLIMWIPASMMSVIGIMLVISNELRQPKRVMSK
ncbi:MAG: cytochrome c oxidase assembly protein [Methylobacter sp.]|nr:cytochrome c oxidase assembly protein [Methylobacter sp.]